MTRSAMATCFVVSVLLASACSGSSSSSARGEDAGVAESQASALIAALGSQEAATNALIIAMDRGYSGAQILGAVDGTTLRGDGTIEGQEPAGPALNLVLYDLEGQDEGASGSIDGVRGEVQLAAFFQIEQTPIERLREDASKNLGVGEPAIDLILRLLNAGYTGADVVEILILGIDGSADYPDEPDGPVTCVRVVDELYCPFGERFPVPPADESDQDESLATDAPNPQTEPDDAAPMQLLWEGELTPIEEFVANPIEGTYKLTRSAGTDEFQIRLATTDAKTGTFTTDGFDSVECTTEWSSVFEGTGTFWDINDLGIEFDGQITRSRVYVAGPCDSVLPTETSDFSGVVVFITETGIEASFNAWEFAVSGSVPTPVSE